MLSSRTSPQTGVAIPYFKGIPLIQGIATPVCALARNDIVFGSQ